MDEGESFCNHLIRPAPFFSAVIVKRGSDLTHKLLLGDAAYGQLKERRAAVKYERQADDDVRERVSRCHSKECQEYTDRLRTGVAHEKCARVAVVPEVDQKNDAKVKHDVVHHGDAMCHDGHGEVCDSGDHCKVSAESVDTVGSVCEVDRYPYQAGSQENVERLRDIDDHIQHVNIYGKREQERSKSTGSDCDHDIRESFHCCRPGLAVV